MDVSRPAPWIPDALGTGHASTRWMPIPNETDAEERRKVEVALARKTPLGFRPEPRTPLRLVNPPERG